MSMEYRYLTSFFNLSKGLNKAEDIDKKMDDFEKIVVTKTGDFVTSDEKFLEQSMGYRLLAANLERLANEQMISNVLSILREVREGVHFGQSYLENKESEVDKEDFVQGLKDLQRVVDSYILYISDELSDN